MGLITGWLVKQAAQAGAVAVVTKLVKSKKGRESLGKIISAGTNASRKEAQKQLGSGVKKVKKGTKKTVQKAATTGKNKLQDVTNVVQASDTFKAVASKVQSAKNDPKATLDNAKTLVKGTAEFLKQKMKR